MSILNYEQSVIFHSEGVFIPFNYGILFNFTYSARFRQINLANSHIEKYSTTIIKQGLPKSNLTSEALVLRLFRYLYTGEGFFLCIKHSVLIDPACGSGGMFIQSGDFVNHSGMNANSAMTFYGQEKVEYNAQLWQEL